MAACRERPRAVLLQYAYTGNFHVYLFSPSMMGVDTDSHVYQADHKTRTSDELPYFIPLGNSENAH